MIDQQVLCVLNQKLFAEEVDPAVHDYFGVLQEQ